MDMRSPFPNALVAASLLVALLSFGCGSPSPSGGGGSESPNQQEGEVIREALANASTVDEMEAAVRDALVEARCPLDADTLDLLVEQGAAEQLAGSQITVADLYGALRASGYAIVLADGAEASTAEFVSVLRTTLEIARDAGPENLAWEIALGGVGTPSALDEETAISPVGAGLIALAWSGAAAFDAASDARDGPLGDAAAGVLTAAFGGSLLGGVAVLAGAGLVTAALVVSAAAGLAIGWGAYMIGSAFVEATSSLNSVAVGLTDSGDLVTGSTLAEVHEAIDEANGDDDDSTPASDDDDSTPVSDDDDDTEPTGRFVPSGSGALLDTETSLVWQQDAEGGMSKSTAEAYCASLSLAGYTDWRLPHYDEMGDLCVDPVDGCSLHPDFDGPCGGTYADLADGAVPIYLTSAEYAHVWYGESGCGHLGQCGPCNDRWVRCVRP